MPLHSVAFSPLSMSMSVSNTHELAVHQALEKIHREKFGGGGTASQFEDETVPDLLRRSIAVYEAARCVIGYMTPHYDEISKVVQPSLHGYFRFQFSETRPWLMSKGARGGVGWGPGDFLWEGVCACCFHSPWNVDADDAWESSSSV